MSWRTVVVRNKSKLDYKQSYLCVRGEETQMIHLGEIDTVVVESTAVSMTAALLCELTKRKIKVIFCDEKYNPYGELSPFYGCHNCSGQLQKQLCWTDVAKTAAKTIIIKNKILHQADLLRKVDDYRYKQLCDYAETLTDDDATNREGLSAKIYFKTLFGADFVREKECVVNAALNYGYAILLSCFNRAVVSNGYSTQLGIFHKNEFNNFNLSCDLMEPFRPLVDRIVFFSKEKTFDIAYKTKMMKVLNVRVKIDGDNEFLTNAVDKFTSSVFSALESGNADFVKDYVYESEIYENDYLLRLAVGDQ